MKKILVCLLLCLSIATGIDNYRLADDWLSFKQTYNKIYADLKIELTRKSIWETNSKFILQHNKEADNGEHTFKLAMNEFGDLSHQEFLKKFTGKKSLQTTVNIFKYFTDINIPVSVDWKNCSFPVREEPSFCDANWAFSVTESLAGIKCVKNKKLIALSAQQLIDCSSSYGNEGCSSGYFDPSYQYLIDNKGIDSALSYPFIESQGICKFKPENVSCTISGFRDIISGNETDLTIALATVGPIPTGFNAGLPSFQFYSSGVYYDPKCSPSIDYVFILTGYGTAGANNEYYIAKNSWGPNWGMNGYVHVARNRNNNCGVASYASYGLVD